MERGVMTSVAQCKEIKKYYKNKNRRLVKPRSQSEIREQPGGAAVNEFQRRRIHSSEVPTPL